jgi:predicted nucleic acid-binding protein
MLTQDQIEVASNDTNSMVKLLREKLTDDEFQVIAQALDTNSEFLYEAVAKSAESTRPDLFE